MSEESGLGSPRRPRRYGPRHGFLPRSVLLGVSPRAFGNLASMVNRLDFTSSLSRTVMRSGLSEVVGRSALELPDRWQALALRTNTELSRLFTGPSYLAAQASLLESGQRMRTLLETPEWLRFIEHQQRQLDGIGRQLFSATKLIRGLDYYFEQAVFASPIIEVERSISVATRAWDDVLRRAPLQPSGDDALRLFSTGRGTLGVLGAGQALMEGDEDPEGEDGAVEELLSRDGLAAQLRNRLAALHPELPSRLDGAWERVATSGPDAASQAAHSLMELVDWSLRIAAPTDEVLEWHRREGRPGEELNEGRPTRALRAKFILRDRPEDRTAARLYLRSLSDLIELVQSLKHELEPADPVAVARLIPTVEGLLIFLYV